MTLIALLLAAVTSSGGDSYHRQDCCGPCSCGVVDFMLEHVEDMPRLAENSEVLFIGRVIHAEIDSCCDDRAVVTFRVKKWWKGSPGSVFAVQTGGLCDQPFPFAVGYEYLVSSLLPQGSQQYGQLSDFFSPLEMTGAFRYELALDEWQKATIAPEPGKRQK